MMKTSLGRLGSSVNIIVVAAAARYDTMGASASFRRAGNAS